MNAPNPDKIRAEQILLGRDSEFVLKPVDSVYVLEMPVGDLGYEVMGILERYKSKSVGATTMSQWDEDYRTGKATARIPEEVLGGLREELRGKGIKD